ncbi:NUDIX hydrolase [Flavobacterium sp. ARAG 55.4]|uniref:NUDIX hydrolase n=1 Tax=Flavobacterium sp. ARAG 55.4 TaxID=3451357 RepID=UPI003F48B201
MSKEFNNKLLTTAASMRENYLAHISIDCVVFGFHDECLKVLLARFEGEDDWVLPGGYVEKKEDLFDAAKRILEQRTGARNIYLNQFKTFGKIGRSEFFFKDIPDDVWYRERFITIGYYALVDFSTLDPVKDVFSDDCSWHDVKLKPNLVMDHNEIYDSALKQLRRDLNYKPVGLNLLPEKFTMPELQKLYEIILDRKLNRGNFYRKMMRYNILTKLDETKRGGAHKSPNLYVFNLDQYNKALEDGFQESW